MPNRLRRHDRVVRHAPEASASARSSACTRTTTAAPASPRPSWALLAGATRVEGTLFGNGERTGNLDIVTVALNLYTQGVDPKLDFSRSAEIREAYERCTKLEVPPRWPYGGDLVFTAFSGSHQDAINKGLKDRAAHPDAFWEVPYLSIDPHDIGRNYRAIIRINSQSGKGGVAYVMEQEFGYQLPKAMHRDFGKIINRVADERGEELPPRTSWRCSRRSIWTASAAETSRA
jgi:2-isopropylmalate synthase